jgi:serine/threonine protein kinase
MPKLYGGRWRLLNVPRLGHGGQSEVFRAIDETGQLKGEFALKRVLNPERHERFRREIDAINQLSHPNIIKLVDHTALDDVGTTE